MDGYSTDIAKYCTKTNLVEQFARLNLSNISRNLARGSFQTELELFSTFKLKLQQERNCRSGLCLPEIEKAFSHPNNNRALGIRSKPLTLVFCLHMLSIVSEIYTIECKRTYVINYYVAIIDGFDKKNTGRARKRSWT